jgi:hypothetical protein
VGRFSRFAAYPKLEKSQPTTQSKMQGDRDGSSE